MSHILPLRRPCHPLQLLRGVDAELRIQAKNDILFAAAQACIDELEERMAKILRLTRRVLLDPEDCTDVERLAKVLHQVDTLADVENVELEDI